MESKTRPPRIIYKIEFEILDDNDSWLRIKDRSSGMIYGIAIDDELAQAMEITDRNEARNALLNYFRTRNDIRMYIEDEENLLIVTIPQQRHNNRRVGHPLSLELDFIEPGLSLEEEINQIEDRGGVPDRQDERDYRLLEKKRKKKISRLANSGDHQENSPRKTNAPQPGPNFVVQRDNQEEVKIQENPERERMLITPHHLLNETISAVNNSYQLNPKGESGSSRILIDALFVNQNSETINRINIISASTISSNNKSSFLSGDYFTWQSLLHSNDRSQEANQKQVNPEEAQNPNANPDSKTEKSSE